MEKTCSRSVSLAAGFIIMLCYGLLYAWSIYHHTICGIGNAFDAS